MLSHGGHSNETSLGALASCFFIFQTEFYKLKKISAVTRIACTQTLFYSASADPEKENIDLFIFHFAVFEIGFYQARSTDFEEKIEAL